MKSPFLRRIPTPKEQASYAHEVVRSAERAGLNRETTLIIGGAALAMAGIRRARDVDAMTTKTTYNDFEMAMQTPSGIRLQRKLGAIHPFLESIPTTNPDDMLAIDITHPLDSENEWRPEFDDELLRHMDTFDEVDGYRYLPPHLVAEHKKPKTGIGRRKDRRDIRRIRRFLKATKTGPQA